jgi:cell division protein FtsB
LREDLLVASDNMLNVSVCRLDDLRQAIARLQKETQALEETDMILKRKIDYVVNSRVRVRQDVLDDMAIGWEFV